MQAKTRRSRADGGIVTTTLVRRPARVQPPPAETDALTIVDPPTKLQDPPAAMGAGMLMMPVMAGTGSLTVALTQRDNPIAAVGGLLFLSGAILVGAIMFISQRTGPRRQLREGRERYLDYVEQLRHTVRDTIAVQRHDQAWRHPRLDALVGLARDRSRRWERRPVDPDFLVLRVGTGDQPLSTRLTMPEGNGPLTELDPVCLQAAQELQERYSVLHEQPVTVDLRALGTLSVLGEPAATRQLGLSLALQLVTLHAPHDVQLAVVRPDRCASAWDWVKWVPHAQDPHALDGDVPARLVASSTAALLELVGPGLEARLDRHQRSRGNPSAPPQHLVVVVDADGSTAFPPVVSPDPSVPLADLGVHVVTLLTSRREEPEQVDDRLEVGADGSATLLSRPLGFDADPVTPGLPEVVARQVSPLRLSVEEGDDGSLTSTVGLPEILGVDDVAVLEPRRTWQPRPLRDLLRVPIGVGGNGNTVMLDLKESAHGGMGPHGLVVGATGAGKSEMLRTLVSSLVIGHGPDRLALMLVDFKGGATFAAMEDIPHLAGMITNLQDDLSLVDRMRDALYGEMQRRQEVLKQAGNLPNVTAYQDLIDAGHDLEPLPHLLVIVDEFSELLTAKPDFAELFVAIGRIGRSIGVHLLLATQRLEMGKIRGLESHLSYRIGLRTFSESESRDAIGVPDAYHLPPEPGSGYLKVDTTVFERFKAALVSSPYTPPAQGPRLTVPVVPYVAANGIGAWVAATTAHADQAARHGEAADGPAPGSASMLDVICRQLSGAGAPRARPVWLEPLPVLLTLTDLLDADHLTATVPTDRTSVAGTLRAPVGLVDDPSRQRQFPLEWDFSGGGGNLVVAGSPSSGKSTLLATMMGSMALRYAPGDVVFYCLDYGGGTLGGLADLPHVATVTTRTDPERIQRTINDVMTVLNQREEQFRAHGVDTMRAWRRGRADGSIPADLPGDVFLVIDGWGNFRDEHEAMEFVVGEIAARGLAYGVHVVLSVTQGMQVRMRMAPAFGGRLELRLNDAYDSAFDRKLMEQVPREAPGRGLTDIDGNLLFQTALPQLGGEIEDESAALAGLVELARERWGEGVARVQVLPTQVAWQDLPAVSLGSDDVPVGLSELNLGPAAVNLFGTSPHLLVYGDGETGKTNLLKVLVRGLTGVRTPQQLGFVVVDYRRTLLDVVPPDYLLAYATGGEQAARATGEICGALHERIPGPDVTSEQLRARSWWKGLEVVVLVDDYDLVATSTGNPLSQLVDLVPQARDLGFHVVLARRTGGLSRAVFEPLLQRLGDVSTPGFLFSGDRMEGRVLGDQAPRRLPVGRAQYVPRGGGGSGVQTALLED
jgi:S-DNA-T family DNA segregation ATPase FtsK/SpoIIIE